jgi:CheY-like chemotaxis protein
MNLLVLVVDDEPDVEALFRQQFRREIRAGRFVMDFAASGMEAIERIKEAEEGSLILLCSDINMPGMTGLELLPRVKAMRPEVPIIMITAYGDAATLRRAKEAGAEDVLGKPIDFAALKAEIDQRLIGRGLPA